MHARARDRLVAVHEILALAKSVEENGHGPDVEPVGAEPHQVIQDPGDLVEHHSDVLGTQRRLDAEQPLDRHHVGVLVAHHGHVVETVHVADALIERLALGELLRRAMEQPDMRVRPFDDLAFHLQHQSQHAVRGRVLGTEVDREALDLRHRRPPLRESRRG